MSKIATPVRQGTVDGYSAVNIYDANGDGLLSVFGIPINTKVSEVSGHFAAGMGVAAEVVRAVNSHSELIEALEFYANPEIYKPHPHGPAFDRRDLSFRARAALAKAKGE